MKNKFLKLATALIVILTIFSCTQKDSAIKSKKRFDTQEQNKFLIVNDVLEDTIMVSKMTSEQADSLRGQDVVYGENDYTFYPVQDCNGNWVISPQEVADCTNPIYLWVKELETIVWCRVPPEDPKE